MTLIKKSSPSPYPSWRKDQPPSESCRYWWASLGLVWLRHSINLIRSPTFTASWLLFKHFIDFLLVRPFGSLSEPRWYHTGRFLLTFSGKASTSRLTLYSFAMLTILLRSGGSLDLWVRYGFQSWKNMFTASLSSILLESAMLFSISVLAILAHSGLLFDMSRYFFIHIISIASFWAWMSRRWIPPFSKRALSPP